MFIENTLVVIPVQNERASVGEVVSHVIETYGMDVVVVDDTSQDDSIAIARDAGATILPLSTKLGAWGAIQTGLRYADQLGYQFVITMDGDGQHHCEEISALFDTMENDVEIDVVIGACLERGSKLRHWAWSFFRRLTGVGIEDITSGFRLYNRRAIDTLVSHQATLLDYQDIGVLLLLQASGIRIEETAVKMTARQSGKSRVYSSWYAVIYYMLLTTVLSLSKGKPFTGSSSVRSNRSNSITSE